MTTSDATRFIEERAPSLGTESRQMPMRRNNKQKKKILLSERTFSFGNAFLVALLIASMRLVVVPVSQSTRAASSSFSFTAVGDYAQTNYTTANLQHIAESGASFHLALGDFAYVDRPTKTTTDQWSTYVKSHLPRHFPFEIVAGNHDPSQMSNFVADLPDSLGATPAANYGKEYSFDYPARNPLVRFILVSPGKDIFGYDYSQGTAHSNWVSQTIDQARTAGISWVIVGMHEHCLVIGSTQCGEGQDLMNLLIGKKVDLILMAHSHSYQASKQLALNQTTCKRVPLTRTEPSCIVTDTTKMSKGAGSVTLILGTGGTRLKSLPDPETDPKKGYFRSWMFANVNPTWGVAKFTVTATSLTEQFVPVTGQQGSGNFADSFTIQAGRSIFTPTPTASMTATEIIPRDAPRGSSPH